jgi:hypothetical protein
LHEASLWEHNCFITLTYSPDQLPPGGDLRHDDFQRFMKRLRERMGREFGFKDIRFLMCGEYGETRMRPHYHAILFNMDFPDKEPVAKGAAGFTRYESPLLRSLWGLGHTEVGNATDKSMGYVARYTTKKLTDQVGVVAERERETVDLQTGEIHARIPEYVQSSRRPGIAQRWLELFHEDCWKGYVTHNEVKFALPEYYKLWLASKFPERYKQFCEDRLEFVSEEPQVSYERLQDIGRFNSETFSQSKSRTVL